ncbi:hypothetical protein J3R83DRAFT_6224 [Lanmaoa asiatica]|nr:hypothetical protein J3R83DRAFT_6224 [Lanmaoa asiatica]
MSMDGESPIPSTPPLKPSSLFDSLRVRSQTGGMVSQPCFKSDGGPASSPSLRLLYPTSTPRLPERPVEPPSSPKAAAIRLPFTCRSRQNQSGSISQILMEEPDNLQPHVLFAGKPSAPRLSLSSLGSPTRQTKKKKLVVSGIATNDTRRLDAIQRWCQVRGVKYLAIGSP